MKTEISSSPSLFPGEVFYTRYNLKVSKAFKRLLIHFLLWGYSLLYHQFAWIYSFAAWLVSAGRWNDWIRATCDFLSEGPVLDVGCGQGVLLDQANRNRIMAFGLDESPQMLKQCKQLLQSSERTLIRGVGQQLPFATASFNTITATFPAPYLFEQVTLLEIKRILTPEGQLVILVTTMISGNSLHDLLIRLIGQLFGFSEISETTKLRLMVPLQQAGFHVEIQTKNLKESLLYFILAKPIPVEKISEKH